MNIDLLLALSGFAAVTLVTPGPNNMMLMASGANFGYRPTLPHMLGITVGFGVMIVLVGLGLMTMFDRFPPLQIALKMASVAFLLWLAWKIAHAAAPGSGRDTPARPITFLQASAFQWVNPKAWAMALTSIAAYAPDKSFTTVGIVALTFATISLFSGTLWMMLGRQARRWLTDQLRLSMFNWTMAALLVATLIPVLFAG